MKKGMILTAFLLVLSMIVASCEVKPPKKVDFNLVIKNPSSYFSHGYNYFNSGVVVFHQQKEGVSVIVVTSNPIPSLDSQLKDDQVLAIKIPSTYYDKTKLGDVIDAKGHLDKATHESRDIYFVDASDVTVTGQQNVKDTDFQTMVNIIKEKENDDDFFPFSVIWFILIDQEDPISSPDVDQEDPISSPDSPSDDIDVDGE